MWSCVGYMLPNIYTVLVGFHHYPFQNWQDLVVGDFNLSTRMAVVWCSDLVGGTILAKQILELSFDKVLPAIRDDTLGDSKAWKCDIFEQLDHCLSGSIQGREGFRPLRYIVHHY